MANEDDFLRQARHSLVSGDHKTASIWFEKACSFDQACDQAMVSGDFRRAVQLWTLTSRALSLVELVERMAPDSEALNAIAFEMSSRGAPRVAALLWERGGDQLSAAAAFDVAGDAVGAARNYDAVGRPADAAKVLENALRKGGEVDEVRLSLGLLYAKHAKHDAAVRALQAIDTASPFRGAAVLGLAASFEALGLTQALADLGDELAAVASRAGAPTAGPVATPAADATADRILYGRYKVVQEIATTPHAQVLKAVDRLTGTTVAIKILLTGQRGVGRDVVQRFVREAQVLERVRHPNVVRLLDVAAQGPAMILEWMDGGSLSDVLDRITLVPARAAEIASAVLSALAEAHRVGVLHRDIKPSNVLFDGAGTARVGDFGAAHLAESGEAVTAAQIGTFAYMAPEQLAGAAATVRTDVYGVGALLHEMLTGSPPDRGVLTLAHPDLSSEHQQLLASWLADSPSDRPADALAARSQLQSLNWSTREHAVVRPNAGPCEPAATAGDRLQALGQDLFHDRWLGKVVRSIPLEDDTLALARAVVRIDSVFAAVLRVDRGRKVLWCRHHHGPSRVPITPSHRVEAETAAAKLVAAGFKAPDLRSLRVVEGRAWLPFPGGRT